MVDPQTWWDAQEQIEEAIAARFATDSTDHWLEVLDAADVWCAPVLTLEQLVEHEGFVAIAMTQSVTREATNLGGGPVTLTTTRSPIRIDGQVLRSSVPAPLLGQHNQSVRDEFAPVSASQ
jgi:CoA:oxalate CoA-transferase